MWEGGKQSVSDVLGVRYEPMYQVAFLNLLLTLSSRLYSQQIEEATLTQCRNSFILVAICQNQTKVKGKAERKRETKKISHSSIGLRPVVQTSL